MKRLLAVLTALLVVALLLTACDGGGVPGPGASKVDVDTPELREAKAAAGIEDCVPGEGSATGSATGLPDLTLPCLGGGPDVDLATLRGPMLINLWYSACGPCQQEMPVLQEFHATYGDRVPLVGLDIEQYPDYAIGFADEVGATYPQLADPGATIFDDGDLGLRQAFPQTIFVDADGEVTLKLPQEIESVDQLVDLVREHLGVSL